MYQAVVEQARLGNPGNLLMDAPPHTSLEELTILAGGKQGRQEWEKVVQALTATVKSPQPATTTCSSTISHKGSTDVVPSEADMACPTFTEGAVNNTNATTTTTTTYHDGPAVRRNAKRRCKKPINYRVR